jgi:hypothetical protein
MTSQLDLWWTRLRGELLADTALASGNRLMLEGTTAKVRGNRLEIHGGPVPLTSPALAALVVKAMNADPPPVPAGLDFAIVDLPPPGFLDEPMKRQRTKDGRVRG